MSSKSNNAAISRQPLKLQIKAPIMEFPPTVILRHRRENLKKCSLRGLEEREDLSFFKYPGGSLPDLTGYVMLSFEGAPLSIADQHLGLFIIDGTWRYAKSMAHFALQNQPALIQRSLPKGLKTAYPRRQEDCSLPERGLASVEALYAAYLLLGRDGKGLLDYYYWKEEFLLKNERAFL